MTEQLEGIMTEVETAIAELDLSKGYSSMTYWASNYTRGAHRAVPSLEDRANLVKAAAMMVSAIKMIDDEAVAPEPAPEQP